MTGRVLLIRLGAMGDTLQASSVAGMLKKQFPHLEIDFLSSAGVGGLFDMIPAVSQVYPLPFRKIPLWCHPWWMAILGSMNRKNYALAYLMETNPRFLPLLEQVRASRKVVLGQTENQEGTEGNVPNPVRYQQGLWNAGLANREICHPELIVQAGQERRAIDLLLSLGLDPHAPLVGLHAGNSFHMRKPWRRKLRRTDLRAWPENRWCDLISEMHRANGHIQFVLFGGPQDRNTNRHLRGRLRRVLPGVSLADAAGKTDLPLAAALLKKFSMFVCTDTGPLHMAAALNVPFIGLYGPTRFDETQPFPAEPVGAVIRKSCPCQPCFGTPMQRTCRENLCMQRIEAEEVARKAMEICPLLFPR